MTVATDVAVDAPVDPRTAAERRADLDLCRGVIRHHARSFSFASRFLPRDLRADTAVVYAYYRRLDDLVDLAAAGGTPGALHEALDGWEQWLAAGAPFGADDPVRRALPEVIRRRGLATADLAEVIGGQRADLDHHRPATTADLDRYCFQVAGSVGLVMATLLGAKDLDHARPAASALGDAMQLTNICRDVAEDLDRGRIYLPLDLCTAHGLDDAALWARQSTPALRAVVADLAVMARARYAAGIDGLVYLPPEARFPIAVAARAYAGILDRLAARDHDPLRGRVSTTRRTRWAMAARLAAAGAQGRRRARHRS